VSKRGKRLVIQWSEKRSFMSIPSPDTAKYPLCVYFLLGWVRDLLPESAGLPKGNIVSIRNTSAAAPIAPPEAAVSSPSYITTR
jgi:hypothetical protein